MDHVELIKMAREKAQNLRAEADRWDDYAKRTGEIAGTPKATGAAVVRRPASAGATASELPTPQSLFMPAGKEEEEQGQNGLSPSFPYGGLVREQIFFGIDVIGRGAHHNELDPIMKKYRPDVSTAWLSNHLSTLFRKQKIRRTKLRDSNNSFYYFRKEWVQLNEMGRLVLIDPRHAPGGPGVTQAEIANMVIE